MLDGDALTSVQAQWRASISPAGATRFAAQAFAPPPQPAELELKLVGLSRGHRRELAELPQRTARGARTELEWGPVVERLEAHSGHLEQSFLFAAAPAGTGALTLTLSLSGFDSARIDERGAHFSVKRSAVGVRYGHGTWVDARGRRTPVPVQRSGETLQLVVPAEVLDASEFPAVLDCTSCASPHSPIGAYSVAVGN